MENVNKMRICQQDAHGIANTEDPDQTIFG